MLKSFTQLFLVTFAMALASSVARADPIVITSGAASVTGSFGAPVYSLTGANFSAVGSGFEFGATGPACLPCAVGDVINTSSNYVGVSLGRGTVTINGSTFDNVFIAGFLTFTGPNIVMPASDETYLTLTAPFTLSGSLVGCLEPHLVCQTILFTTQVSGSGLATIQYHSYVDQQWGRLFDFRSVTYTFDTTTVPEPASIAMLLSSLAALGAVKLKRRGISP